MCFFVFFGFSGSVGKMEWVGSIHFPLWSIVSNKPKKPEKPKKTEDFFGFSGPADLDNQKKQEKTSFVKFD